MYAGVTKSTRSSNSGSSLHVGATPLMQAPRIVLCLVLYYYIACTSTTVPLQRIYKEVFFSNCDMDCRLSRDRHSDFDKVHVVHSVQV
jgi:hypothetical protein